MDTDYMTAVHQDRDRMIDWAERLNAQWTEETALAEPAAAWMDHVQQHDPERLEQGIQKAFRSMMGALQGSDLKTPFYQGLLSEASSAERKQFQLQTPKALAA